jgi:hypothetical protein
MRLKYILIGLLPSHDAHVTNFIELNRLCTTQLTIVFYNWLNQQHVSALFGHHQAYKN